MLRKLRLTLAVLFFVAVTALFLDFTGTVHAWLGWTAKIQFLPALLALNVGVIVALVLLTLLLGRVYCSVICPLGVMQDIVSWISGRRKTKRYRFSYSPEIKWLRYGVLGLFVIALIAGIGSFVALLAPYSSYGRIASNLFAPLYRWGNNLLAYFAERADSYAFYETEVWMKSLPTFVIAALTLVVLAVLAWRNGRTYCNTICPVGTILGFFSRFSLFRPVLDAEKCRNCSLCRAAARPPASTTRTIASTTAAAWRAWTAWTPANTTPCICNTAGKKRPGRQRKNPSRQNGSTPPAAASFRRRPCSPSHRR